MTDAAVQWRNDGGYADLRVVGSDLATDDGLGAAVVISLFTDARAEIDELPEGDGDRRGSWHDGLNNAGDETGSKLWLLRREKQTSDVPQRAAALAREALQWMLEDGVASAVDASTEWVRRGELALRVAITMPDRSRREFQFGNVLGAA